MRPVVSSWLAAVSLIAGSLCGCSERIDFAQGQKMTGGDPEAGKQAIVLHDCHSCHVIPGIEGEQHVQGPALDHWASRKSIAKQWPNTPADLENWIRHSEQLLPGTTMKMMSVNEKDARDIAAYLYSLN
ncbi:MAG TPA: c-type cytochrome [Terriglobales bacterium]|jgi:cytochrome c